MMKRLSIRWRLTLWYGGVVAALLAIFGTAVYLTMRHHQLERIDRGLAVVLKIRCAVGPKLSNIHRHRGVALAPRAGERATAGDPLAVPAAPGDRPTRLCHAPSPGPAVHHSAGRNWQRHR